MSQSLRTFPFKAPKTLAVAVVSLVLLSGCAGAGASSDESSAAALPKTSASATPTLTPTPTPSAVYKPASAEGPAQNVPLPKMPEAATKETKAGLQAFGKYVIALFSYGYETGDVKPVKAVISSDCDLCANYFKMVKAGYEDDDWLGGAKLDVLGSTSVFKKTPDGKYQLILDITQEPTEYFYPGGKFPETGDSSWSAFILEAKFIKGVWHASELSSIKGSS
ncbi:DUF6318 family protein [Arthrobacter roseus]|uniref:DUF6318 family protein n=1 Tax=Arthrobacter roseus TaxID=136274 RepID=UPI00196560A2|nr:DUF6318 family protein [Arthrobacter roseus]MBM7847686.1 hypothetical protein [Arthrobacter roseus]